MDNPLDALKNTLQSEQFKKIMPYLLAGGAGAVGSTLMTGGRRGFGKRKESRMGYLGRVLRNALVTGGIAAGGTALARYGADKLSNKTTTNGLQASGMDNPTDQVLRASLFSPAAATGAGIAGLAATHHMPWIGSDATDVKNMRELFVSHLNPPKTKNPVSLTSLQAMSPAQLTEALKGTGKTLPDRIGSLPLDKALQRAGLTMAKDVPAGQLTNLNIFETLKKVLKSPSSIKTEARDMGQRFKQSPVGTALDESGKAVADGFKKTPGSTPDAPAKMDFSRISKVPGAIAGNLDELLKTDGAVNRFEKLRQLLSQGTRRGPLSTFGQTNFTRGMRGSVGLASATIPALIGAFATDEKQDQ